MCNVTERLGDVPIQLQQHFRDRLRDVVESGTMTVNEIIQSISDDVRNGSIDDSAFGSSTADTRASDSGSSS